MAIIDIGSNTIRLVLYKYNKTTGLREIGNIKKVARLRKYLQENGDMSDEGINLLADTLKDFKRIIDDYGVVDVTATATAAIRQAKNKQKIINQMKMETGIVIQILSGEEEAYYGYLAVVYSIDTPSAVTIDIGGGSTEITYYKNKNIEKSFSFPFGTVSLKQKFVSGDIISLEEKMLLRDYVYNQFKNLNWIVDKAIPVIAIGGSARNIGQIHQHLINYPIPTIHQYEMEPKDLIEINQYLEGLTYEQLKQLDGLSSDRADMIGIALEVFTVLVTLVNAPSFQISKKGLREGLLIHRILKSDKNIFHKYNIFEENAKNITLKYGRSIKESQALISIAEKFYLECCRLNLLNYKEQNLELLKKAACFYGIGEYIDQENTHQHTLYLIANQSIAGISHIDRIKVALVASYKNKEYFRKFAAPFSKWLSKDTLKEMKEIGAILKFISSLNVSKRDIVKTLELEKKDNLICIVITTNSSGMAEIYHTDNYKKHIERILKYPVEIQYYNEGEK